MLKDRLGTMLEKKEKTNQGQAGFRPDRICRYHVRTLGKIIQGRKDARLTTQCVCLDVQKADDTVVRRNELWKSCEKNWDQRKDVENGEENGRMCRKCYDAIRGNME